MGRRPRLDPEGGWHHVMNRGLDRRTIFHVKRDGERFEQLLGEGHEQFGVEVHAYCLMPNHYHLLVHCPDGGLSAFMQRLGSLYTRHVNERLSGDGPVFRGRFRSLPIDSDVYLACAGRYVHRNPVDLRPPVALDTYRWSSYRVYCGLVPAPAWLIPSLSDVHGGHDGYRSFVEGDGVPPTAEVFDWAIRTAIAECDHYDGRRSLDRRTVAAALLDRLDGTHRAVLESTLSFPSDGAWRAARCRARRRMAEDGHLSAVVNRARELGVTKGV